MRDGDSDGIRAKLQDLVPDHIDVSKDFQVELTDNQRVGLTWGDLLEYQAIQSGCKGNTKTLAETLDRAYGKVAQVNKNENLNVEIGYEDFIEKIAGDEAEMIEAGIVQAEVSEVIEDPLAEFL